METVSTERFADRWRDHAWPPIPLAAWKPTYETLHRFTQVVGKIRLGLAPPRNHWWHVPLYVSARGLTTSLMPYRGGGLQIDFDFVDHQLRIATTLGDVRTIPLASQSVASFHDRVMDALRDLTCDVVVWTTPVEVEDRTPFELDVRHCAYDGEAAARFWRALVSAQAVIDAFESRFVGKVSPTHFFWGAFDLASTRFSGRLAPEHPGAPNVARYVAVEAYSHEVSSAGLWPGGGGYDDAAFYAYAYPEPPGYRDAVVEPREAFYSDDLREWLLPYEVVRRSRTPERTLTRFLETTYEAAASLGGWERRALERA